MQSVHRLEFGRCINKRWRRLKVNRLTYDSSRIYRYAKDLRIDRNRKDTNEPHCTNTFTHFDIATNTFEINAEKDRVLILKRNC